MRLTTKFIAGLAALALAAAVGPVRAAAIYVEDTGCGVCHINPAIYCDQFPQDNVCGMVDRTCDFHPGAGTISDPFCTIQRGIDAAVNGDRVLVGSSVYEETLSMKPGVSVIGEGAATTVVDATGTGRSVVTFINSIFKPTLRGLTLTGGGGPEGGGVRIYNSDPEIIDCIIVGNEVTEDVAQGGGIFVRLDSIVSNGPIIRNNYIGDNVAVSSELPNSGEGGGIYVSASIADVIVEHNIIENNRALRGGGILLGNLRNSSVDISRNQLLNNEAPAGAGMFASLSSSGHAEVFNNLVRGNGSLDPVSLEIAFGSPTRYLANLSDPGIGMAWTAPSFATPTWSEGQFGLGYEFPDPGPGVDELLLTVVPDGTTSIFARSTFTLLDTDAVQSITLGADYDDGYAAWINGQEVYRSPSMPPGELAWNTNPELHESSNGEVPDYGTPVDISSIAIPALRFGENVFAVAVWNYQQVPPSSDLVIVPQLLVNTSGGLGGGLMMRAEGDGEFKLFNNTIVENVLPSGSGGGVFLDDLSASTSTSVVSNNIVSRNTGSSAVAAGGGMDHRNFRGTVRSNDFWANTGGDLPLPDQSDADADAVGDACDNCAVLPNAGQGDFDEDGVGDPCDPDDDNDGHNDGADACPRDAANDVDGDAFCADIDNCPAVPNGFQANIDLDSHGDACDNCPAVLNDDQADRDGDGQGNACDTDDDGDGVADGSDTCPLDAFNDVDVDGVCGDVDICPGTANSDQGDEDGDGVGDLCDLCPTAVDALQPDADADLIGDACDNCPGDWNGGQEDIDFDDVGDLCDPCPADPGNDADGDGLCADEDNCPTQANPGQEDTDADGLADACDNCPAAANADQADYDEDGVGDACDTDDDADGVADASDNCPLQYNPGQESVLDTDGVGDACDNCPTVNNAPSDCDANPATPNVQCNSDTDTFGNACDLDDDDDDIADTSDTCTLDPLNDADADGRCANVDNCPTVANASQGDTDLDKVGGVCDNCASVANPLQENNDGDASGDACDTDDDNDTIPDVSDLCPFDASNDVDGDGICGNADNCPSVSNPAQLDLLDGDGVGDACDNCPSLANDQADVDLDGLGDDCDEDNDADLIPDLQDNCVYLANTDQADGDADRVGDACDSCPATFSFLQTDTDLDGLGDACDTDDDNDGLLDGADNCPLVAANPATNSDADALGNACDNCPTTTNAPSDCDANPLTPLEQCDWDEHGRGDACDTDDDNDNVLDVSDLCPLDDLDDIDGDLLCGNVDNCPLLFNPSQGDIDLDGIGNSCDSCFSISNRPSDCDNDPATEAEQCDEDDDGVGDACDPCTDGDGDGFGDPGQPANTCPTDNCFEIPNPQQDDLDNDGIGDACDNDDDGDGLVDAGDMCPQVDNPAPIDGDGDGVGDDCDNCLSVANADQHDLDDDGLGDACDPCTDGDGDTLGNPGFPASTCALDACPFDGTNDADGDGVCQDVDNCPGAANPTQSDVDEDGMGDACDGDDDGDLVDDAEDNCALVFTPGGSLATLDNNLFLDPKFASVGSGNFRLLPTSPAVDAAAEADAPPEDIDRYPRPVDGNGDLLAKSDLGAYEFPYGPQFPLKLLTGGAITWPTAPASGGFGYHLYRGSMTRLRSTGVYTQDPGIEPLAAQFCGITAASVPFADGYSPPTGQVVFYLVELFDAEGPAGGLGTDSSGNVRPNTNPCP